ncbi:MAG: glycerophosphodiester phosphodiesterase [Rhizobiaceae bacterium]
MPAKIITLLICMFMSASTALAFDLQGHRGARGLAPENTLPAFAKALSIGVTTLELDTGISSDGVVVVTHNPTLKSSLVRDANGKWVDEEPRISSMTFAELQKFDVGAYRPGSREASRFPQQTGMENVAMPSLAELFALVERSGNKQVRFNIETKINPTKPGDTVDPEKFAKALVAEVEKAGLSNRVSIQSFDWRTLQVVQSIAPDIQTVYLSAQQRWMDTIAGGDGGDGGNWTAGFKVSDYDNSVAKMIKAAGGQVWSPFYGDLAADKVKKAQALGLAVIPWTVNEEAAMETLMDMGVDGIITDYPDILRSLMQRRGMDLPAATPVQP